MRGARRRTVALAWTAVRSPPVAMNLARTPKRETGARLVAALIVTLSTARGAAAAPDDSNENREKARVIVAEGARLFDEGKFAEALARYRAAHALFPSPKLYYNMAFAYRGLGKHAEAIFALERFLRDARDAAPEHVSEARAEIGRLSRRVAFVSLASNVAGAEVLLDGSRIGTTPLASRTPVDAGRHEVVLRSTAHGSRARTFTASAGKSIELRVDFEPEPSGTATRAAKSAPAAPARQGKEDTAITSAAAQAEALIREATELRRAGQDVRAYPLLQKAHEVATTPRTAAQLGLVEMQLGYTLEAEKHLTESLSSPRDPWIASNRADLEASLARLKAAIGEILVRGSPPGATVFVNGKPAGTLPLTVARSGEGPAKVEVRSPGHASAFRSLIIVGGRREDITVTLEKAAAEPAQTAERAARAETSLGDQPHAPDRTEDSDHRVGLGRFSRPLAWTSAGVAAIAAGFAGYQSIVWRKKFVEFEDYRAPAVPGMSRTCGVDEPNHGPRGCDAIYSDLKRAQKLAIAGYAAAGLLAAGAAALFLWGPDDREAFACAAAHSGGLCRISF
jgi:tetratricopeptide (TPR) repeat protein